MEWVIGDCKFGMVMWSRPATMDSNGTDSPRWSYIQAERPGSSLGVKRLLLVQAEGLRSAQTAESSVPPPPWWQQDRKACMLVSKSPAFSSASGITTDVRVKPRHYGSESRRLSHLESDPHSSLACLLPHGKCIKTSTCKSEIKMYLFDFGQQEFSHHWCRGFPWVPDSVNILK